MPLSKHVYCVVITFKITEQLEQQICTIFCVKLEHSSTETIQMIQKTAGMGTGDWQLHLDNATVHVSQLVQSFSREISNNSGDSAPLQPRFGAL